MVIIPTGLHLVTCFRRTYPLAVPQRDECLMLLPCFRVNALPAALSIPARLHRGLPANAMSSASSLKGLG